MSDPARLLIAGGAGFLGAALARAYLAQGARVTVLDNFSTGSRDVARSLAAAGAELIEGDIRTPPPLPAADLVLNLACPASPRHYQADPIATWETNVLGTRALALWALDIGATFLQASTSEVYGDPLSHPQREEDWGHVNPLGPRACYDEGKRAAETLLSDLARHRGLDLRIARIFNTYGPGMGTGDGRILPSFLARARAGQPLLVFGDGTQTRSLCHVDDMVRGLQSLAQAPQAAGQVVNLGNPDERSVLDIARAVIAATGSAAGWVHQDLPQDDPVRRRPDITRARSLLGWEPQIDFDTGLTTLL